MKSMYIHIPFCKNICSYCDFSKVIYQEELANIYLINLEKEINIKYKNEEIETLYIGGGTPSILSYNNLDNLFSIIDLIPFKSEYEFTFECNVEDITIKLLIFLKQHRVNRLSIGVETFQNKFLTFLNRAHTGSDSIEKINLAKSVGFDNISIDLMYAFSDQTLEDVEKDLQIFNQLCIPHVSIYSLIIEDNTMLSINKVRPIDEETDASMYFLIQTELEKHGYIHYEVSNYTKKGYESKHNLTYWNNQEYYGFGLGAGCYMNNIRYNNTRSINQYNTGNYTLFEELQSDEDNMSNEMILGLRKLEGVSKISFFKRYGKHISDSYDIMELLEKHLLDENETHYFIPKNKIYISNKILIHFL